MNERNYFFFSHNSLDSAMVCGKITFLVSGRNTISIDDNKVATVNIPNGIIFSGSRSDYI